jgi:hypothetical protein
MQVKEAHGYAISTDCKDAKAVGHSCGDRGERSLAASTDETLSVGLSLELESPAQPEASEALALGTCTPGIPYSVQQSGPPLPGCEKERLETINSLSILDAPPTKELENILNLVCNIFNTKNALIALFGDRRIFILDSVGAFQPGDFPWRNSFCGWTMASEQAQVMVVNDATADARCVWTH